MCGIIGYVGRSECSSILLEGLRRLEYRGYDSAGVASAHAGALQVRKRQGRIEVGLARLLEEQPLRGTVGIGHTRWATHGPPSDLNSHPHLDQSGHIAIVHNGIVENCDRLKEKLAKAGHVFRSATDTEVLAHWIGHHDQRRRALEPGRPQLAAAVCDALREVIGTYGLAVISSQEPEIIVGARRGSPLIIGIGDDGHFLASDSNAIVAHTSQVVYLNDYDVATLSAASFEVQSLGTDTARVQISKLAFASQDAERGAHPHFMLKEIFEQPRTVENALRGRLDLEGATARFGGLNMTSAELRGIERIVICASGTSWHAALVGEYLIEELAHLPVEVEYAHEFYLRNAPLQRDTIVLVISQSGETADTLGALREARRRGHKTMAIVNVVGSTIARETDGGIYMHAGPEIGVASTKAFVSQLVILTLLAVHLGRMRMLSVHRALEILHGLQDIPAQIQTILDHTGEIQRLALKYRHAKDFFFLSRGYTFPIALEGALKLKEISYIHAEGYSAAEMKHGPIALIEPKTPSLFLVPRDAMYEKTMANMAMIRARDGTVIALATEGDDRVAKSANDVMYVPRTQEPLYPILTSVPLQLFAYYMAVALGRDVDKPRNLAKSVTVE